MEMAIVAPAIKDDDVHASMNSVICDKATLIATLKANRETHRASFEAALEGYQKRAIELLNEHIERIRNGKVEQVFVSLPQPKDHTDEYDSAIEMLEWSLLDKVELSQVEFNRYVRDNWTWKEEFITTNAMYSR